MLRVVLVVLVVGFAACARAGFHWEKELLCCAAAPGTGKVTARFAFTNTGKTAVKVLDLKSTCGCTVATLERRTFAPGESGEVVAVYSTAGRKGLHEAVLTVKTDDPVEEETRLRLRVLVQEAVVAQPTFLLWEKGEARVSKRVSVQVTDGFGVKGVEAVSATPGVDARLVGSKGGGAYELVVTPGTDAPSKAVVELTAQVPGGKQKPVLVHVRVR